MSAVAWSLILAGVALNAAAQLLLKVASAAIGPIALTSTGLGAAAPRLFAHYGWWGGVCCYVASVFIWVLALSRAPVSVAYPMLSLGYIVNAVGGRLLFGETLSTGKLAGIAVIIVGVCILTQSRA